MSDSVTMGVEITKALSEYRDLTVDELKKAVRKAAKSIKSDISEASPRKTGAYAKDWTVTTQAEDSGSISLVVHNKNHYQLTHLLENSHALRNGGRTRAFPHILPAEEKGLRQLEDELTRSLKS